ncbi:hypothetical protein Cst_c13240 [Thermoclostridium stercorarium subsp. stercorarium DSM 8532]|uniref:Uncharacterized protein n=2 Tax=Thermoclostridium stercorarium TaxID=1510 RepID=L7VJM9_THES1|nr:hypothetical protein [Thermoclostridium stercorarium]AGC68315.1 hypothetical protein Cst_c13240 [Thermoclostridium stercorarium subsp. stercorarium DSM 8532]ANW98664.1 hypothetical protein CSTERTH_06280 [Thermoclostridium stercorarium subsp. thermolacticum DSM 2910]
MEKFNYNVKVEHDSDRSGGNKKTHIKISFTNARGGDNKLFTGEQRFKVEYRIADYPWPFPDEYASAEITVSFNNGKGEYTLSVDRNYSITSGTTRVIKLAN